jgi:HAMP domain-containing protein
MTNPDQLKDHLEDLFSDVIFPEPQVPEEPVAPEPPLPDEPALAAIQDDVSSRLRETFETEIPPPIPPAAKPVAAAIETPELPELEPLVSRPPSIDQVAPGTLTRVARRVSKYWRIKLGRTLVLAFLVVAMTPAVIIATFDHFSRRSQIRNNVLNNLELLATLHTNQIEQWIQAETTDLYTLAHEPPLERQIRNLLVTEQNEDEKQTIRLSIKSRLQNFMVQHPEFGEVFLLDADGQVIISTATVHEGELENLKIYFVQGREESYYGPPAFSEEWNTLRLTFAEPLRYITGETIGLMVGFVTPDPLTELIRVAPGPEESGETYLVNERGILVSSLRNNVTPAPGDVVSSLGSERAVMQESGRGAYNNYANHPVLGVYRWLPEAQMGLLSEQMVDEADRAPFVWGIPIVATLSVAVTILLGNLIAQRITQPVIQITESARRMVAGDLNQAVAINREDEIGTLGRAFNHMVSQLRTTVAGLEKEVAERTNMLQEANYRFQKRAIQLEVSAEVSRAAASILDPQELMQTTVDLIRARFGFYHVSFFLLDETGEWAVVHASTGAVGRQMVAQPHRLAVGGESMVGWVCAQRQPRVALDVGEDAVHFDNPLLPDTRSEMALPLRIGNRLLGALNVQSTAEAAFDDDDVRTLQGMADLVAIALENAHLFTETRRGVLHQQLVARVTDRMQRATNIADILTLTLEDLGETFDLAQATVCLGTEVELLQQTQDPALTGGDGRKAE